MQNVKMFEFRTSYLYNNKQTHIELNQLKQIKIKFPIQVSCTYTQMFKFHTHDKLISLPTQSTQS